MILNSCMVFLQFMRRDLFSYRKHIFDNIINYALIYPVVFAIETAYFQGQANFTNPSPTLNTILFAGNILLVLLLFTEDINIELLFDLENKRFIDYQITLLNPFLVILERIIFTGLYCFFMSLPYYPVGGLFLGSYVNLSNTNWPQLFLMLFAGSMCLSAYHLLAAVVLKSSADIGTMWSRVNSTMMLLGGFLVPLWAMKQYSPILATVAYINPCLYLTEGLKHAITGSHEYLSFGLCFTVLQLYTILFTVACWWQFKRRTDCL